MDFEDGATILSLFERLFKKYKLKDVILDEKNEINNYINILKNGRNIKYIKGTDTSLTDGDVIAFFPPVAGG